MNKQTTTTIVAIAIIAMVLCYTAVDFAYAAVGGAGVTNISTSTAPTRAPQGRADPSGSITTVVLNSIQQDYNWKGYVGNVSGRLSLQNVDGFVIYDWPIEDVGAKVGEVYLSRANSLLFTNVTCANVGNITAEQTYFGMTALQSDNINRTFNYTSHQSFIVGSATGITTIAQNSCRSTATYLNGTNVSQTMNGAQKFQQILLQDPSNVIYVTIINASTTGFDNQPYDFQMIVPESTNGTMTTYYFFTELG